MWIIWIEANEMSDFDEVQEFEYLRSNSSIFVVRRLHSGSKEEVGEDGLSDHASATTEIVN